MLSQRKLIQTIESHIPALVATVAYFRFCHRSYLERAEKQKKQRLAQAKAEREAAFAAYQVQYIQ